MIHVLGVKMCALFMSVCENMCVCLCAGMWVSLCESVHDFVCVCARVWCVCEGVCIQNV